MKHPDYNSVKKALLEKKELTELNQKEVFVLEGMFVKSKSECEYCGNKNNLSYDHIIPRTILADFNINDRREYWEENGQVLCHACNHKKAMHLDLRNPKTIPLLKELINKIL